MPRNITGRLDRLKNRRNGMDRYARLNDSAKLDVLAKSLKDEKWQTRVTMSRPYTRYAIGAMQEVGPDYTRISKETAERIGKQLKTGLEAAGFSVDFRLQGSVPANLHIRGVSDVDLLNLDTSFYTYDRDGLRSQRGLYTSPTTRTSIGVLTELRRESEKILKAAYPAAEVDCSGGKAISISGGSLARPVDVVPSHWWDCIAYQVSGAEHERGVTILNKKIPITINNYPFLHIKRINDRDLPALGGLKMAIRLCKNVKNDAEADGTSIPLPSFDIAATMYHVDIAALSNCCVYDLAVLAETQRFLDYLYNNESEARKLRVPDGSRLILDTDAKWAGLRQLSVEIDDLAREVAKEQAPSIGASPTLFQSREVLAKSYLPAA